MTRQGVAKEIGFTPSIDSHQKGLDKVENDRLGITCCVCFGPVLRVAVERSNEIRLSHKHPSNTLYSYNLQ